MRSPTLLLAIPLLTACGDRAAHAPQPPAHAEPVAHESELLRVTLSPDAVRRLGIATVVVGTGASAAVRATAGEMVAPPTSTNGVPTGSLTNLQAIGAQQAAADGEIARAAAQTRLAGIALNRTEELIRAEAGSVRARDEAAAAFATAQAALGVAQQQRRLLGPSIGSLASLPVLWVRASIFAVDMATIRRGVAATVRPLGAAGQARPARPVAAPPSANTAAGTVDLYYAVANRDGAYRVGQRVSVDVPVAGQSAGLTVPTTAVVRDSYGGEWVYEQTGRDTFVRQRIAVAAERDGQALLAQGLTPGVRIVTAGAAELFGTEFGAAH